MADRELYPNAPVVLVALEVRHPNTGPLSQEQQRKIKQRLAHLLPIQRMGQLTNIEAVVGDSSAPTIHVEKFPKYFTRDSTSSASFREGAIVVETTRYRRWEELRRLVDDALRARQEVAGVDGVERLGLRYIDEIRVPDEADIDWEPWIDTSLLGPVRIGEKLEMRPRAWQGIGVFAPGPLRTVVLRYGPREGYAVDPGGDLKRPTPIPGPFFLMDIDSFWTPDEGIPELDVEKLLATCDELHSPVRMLFESLITERLRKEVLRGGG